MSKTNFRRCCASFSSNPHEAGCWTRGRLSQSDLQAALDACGGFGYATTGNLEYDDESASGESESGKRLVKILDAQIVARFNELGLSRDDLNLWVDSKLGRWLVDAASGLVDASTQDQAVGANRLAAEWITVAWLRKLRKGIA